MGIIQPEENIKLPKDLEAKVKKVRVQLAINEQEVITLQEAEGSLKKLIRQLVKDEKYLKEKVSTLTETKSNLNKEIQIAESNLENLEKATTEFIKTQKKVSEENDKKSAELVETSIKLDSREKIVEARENIVKIAEEKLQENKLLFDKKAEKLKEVLK